MLAKAISPRVRVPMSMVTEHDDESGVYQAVCLQSVPLSYSYDRPSDDLQTI